VGENVWQMYRAAGKTRKHVSIAEIEGKKTD
jgi:hypothetical protein